MVEIEEQDYRVRVELMEGYQFKVTFRDELPSLWMDEPEPVGDGEFPNAGLILAASVGNCLAASLTYCLRKARAEVRAMRADVVTKLERNDRGRLRITSMSVVLNYKLDDPKKLERCREIFEDFCIVSQSVKQGIPVKVELAALE